MKICSCDGCERGFSSHRDGKPLCATHYYQAYRGYQLTPIGSTRKKSNDQLAVCLFETCNRKGRKYCPGHAAQLRRGQPLRPLATRKSNSSGEWKTNSEGYVYRNAWSDTGKSKRVFQHREVMETILGRPLTKGENVHHLNGMRNDNNPENLQLWVTSQPSGANLLDVMSWMRDFIDRHSEDEARLIASGAGGSAPLVLYNGK